MNQIRTDLALEAHQNLVEAADDMQGITCDTRSHHNIQISHVRITTDAAAQKMGKPKGDSITLDLANCNHAEREQYENACKTLAQELNSLLLPQHKELVLVVGLGNQQITPDSLGPKAVTGLLVTRHLFATMPEAISDDMRPVCAISPGVLGLTGMETLEVIEGICEKIRPDIVIAIDALAARSMDRISTTIQLCNTGIIPGAGVNNRRKALNRDTLGVPVIAVGVPTVIDAVTLACDVVQAGSQVQNSNQRDDKNASNLNDTLPDKLRQFIVAPKDIDILIDRISKVVANGINLAMHTGLSLQDIEAYLS